jgi:hypothetical protein
MALQLTCQPVTPLARRRAKGAPACHAAELCCYAARAGHRVLLALALVLGVFAVDSVEACSCQANVSVRQHYSQADLVFTAIIERTAVVGVPEPLTGDAWLDGDSAGPAPRVLAGFLRLQSIFKGDPSGLEVVYTHQHSATCGLPFERGDRYLFFSDGRGVVQLCGGSQRSTSPSWEQTMRELNTILSSPAARPPRPTLE